MVAFGFLNYLHCEDLNIHIDLIPVDVVSNWVLLTSAYAHHVGGDYGSMHVYN